MTTVNLPTYMVSLTNTDFIFMKEYNLTFHLDQYKHLAVLD
jgi:hypothetical protein